MGTGFALVLRFCGTLGHGFVGGAGFGGGTGNSVRFGDGNGGCDGRSGKSGGGLESERFRFGFGFRHLGRFDFAVNNIVQVVIAADDEQRLAKRVGEEIINGVRIRSFFVNGFVAVVVAIRVNGGGAVADIEFAGDVVAAELDIVHEGGRAVVEDIADGKRDGEISISIFLPAPSGKCFCDGQRVSCSLCFRRDNKPTIGIRILIVDRSANPAHDISNIIPIFHCANCKLAKIFVNFRVAHGILVKLGKENLFVSVRRDKAFRNFG